MVGTLRRQLPVLCHVFPLSQVTLRDAVGNDTHLAMLPVLYMGREWPIGYILPFLCHVFLMMRYALLFLVPFLGDVSLSFFM
jgi:hypothetical protein